MNAHNEGQRRPKTDTGDREPVVLLTIPEAARRLAIGRGKLYGLISTGEIEVLHIGRAVRVPVEAIEEFVAGKRRRDDYRAGLFPAAPSTAPKEPHR